MCKNVRNRCSALYALMTEDERTKNNEAIKAFTRLVNGRESKKAVAVRKV